MASKFNDRMATRALTSALDAHEAALSKQREIEQARTQLQAELLKIEVDLERNSQPFTGGDLSTAAEIDAAVTSQENKRTELEHARDLAKRKLRLIDDARTRAGLDLMTTRPNVAEARAALAAAFERWTMALPEIKTALKTMASTRATWDSALAGCLDVDAWCRDLLWDCQPTREQSAAADSLLSIPADE